MVACGEPRGTRRRNDPAFAPPRAFLLRKNGIKVPAGRAPGTASA